MRKYITDQAITIPVVSELENSGFCLLLCERFNVKARLEARPPKKPVRPIPFPGPIHLIRK